MRTMTVLANVSHCTTSSQCSLRRTKCNLSLINFQVFNCIMPDTVTSKKENCTSATQPKPINATLFRRYLTLLTIKLLKRF
jgi:hypothetical protein